MLSRDYTRDTPAQRQFRPNTLLLVGHGIIQLQLPL